MLSELTTEVPLMTGEEIKKIHHEYIDVVDYRKSGLSLNHIVGCPMNCSYCIRHAYDNFMMKSPRAIMSDSDAVNELISNKYFKKNITPLQLFNRATDPFLPAVKPHTFNTIKMLDKKGFRNNLLMFTRFKVTKEDTVILNNIKRLSLTILVTYSGINDGDLEPIPNSIPEESLKILFSNAKNYKVILAWRPIITGINDTDEHFNKIQELSEFSHGVAFTGLFLKKEIKDFFEDNEISPPYDDSARRKILPYEMERQILKKLKYISDKGKLFRKVSCCVSANRSVPDYNGHYGIKEICDICPPGQKHICKISFKKPQKKQIDTLINDISDHFHEYELKDNSIEIEGLKEQQRYYIQHNSNFQTHDVKYKHLKGQHGKALIGWEEINKNKIT